MAYSMAFYAGTLDKIQSAVGTTITYPAYVFIRSEEDSNVGQLGFVDKENKLKLIKGENKEQVVTCEELPAVEDGDTGVLYIKGGIVYTFNGEAYIPQYVDYSADIDDLDKRVTALEEVVIDSGLLFVDLDDVTAEDEPAV